MNICKMKNSDWNDVSSIYEEGIQAKKYTIVKEVPTYEVWTNDHIKNLCFVAKNENQTVGFIALSKHKTKENAGVISVYVKNGFKRQGVGTKLILKLKSEISKYGYNTLYSFVFYDNIPSIELHKKCGFDIISVKKLKEDIRNILILEAKNV